MTQQQTLFALAGSLARDAHLAGCRTDQEIIAFTYRETQILSAEQIALLADLVLANHASF